MQAGRTGSPRRESQQRLAESTGWRDSPSPVASGGNRENPRAPVSPGFYNSLTLPESLR